MLLNIKLVVYTTYITIHLFTIHLFYLWYILFIIEAQNNISSDLERCDKQMEKQAGKRKRSSE